MKSQNSVPLTFTNIIIRGTFQSSEYIFDQPATLQTDLRPVDNYMYCAENKDDKGQVKITVATSVEQNAILAFGFYGRMHDNDGKPLRSYTVAEISGGISVSGILIPAVFIAILLIALFIGFFLYRKSKKYNVIEL